MSVKLYGTAMSTCAQRVLFTAFELGHPVELIPVDFMKGEHKQPEHLARNPFGKVPAAQDGDLIMYESRAICRYLIDKYAHEDTIKLVPSDIKQRAIFEQWMCLETANFNPEVIAILRSVHFAKYRGIPKDEAAENLIRDGAVLNKQLDGKTWIVNDTFSLVDICLVTYVNPVVNEPEIKEWLAAYPNIAAWFKNVTARPAFQKVMDLMKQ